ncbi:MAG: Wzz/FepE/Etk N-terminal domain-containing protein [Candidatus Woesebacteria bacterium]|jgi:capsular polysaccharide biosynthesis protein
MQEQDINLYHLLQYYAKKWIIIAVFTLVGAACGLAYNSFIQTPLYRSDSTLLLVGTSSATDQRTTLINNYIELIKSHRVLDPVLQNFDNKISYEDLTNAISTANEKNTEVIKLSVDSEDAQTSQKLADGVVKSFRAEIKKMYNLDNIIVVDNASLASEPYNVHEELAMILSAAAGFCLSVIAIFFAYDINLLKNNQAPKADKKANKKPKATLNRRAFVKKMIEILVGPSKQPTSSENDAKATKQDATN